MLSKNYHLWFYMVIPFLCYSNNFLYSYENTTELFYVSMFADLCVYLQFPNKNFKKYKILEFPIYYMLIYTYLENFGRRKGSDILQEYRKSSKKI